MTGKKVQTKFINRGSITFQNQVVLSSREQLRNYVNDQGDAYYEDQCLPVRSIDV